MTMDEYVLDVVELINRTPDDVIFHRLTGTASANVLLAPEWCSKKWQVLNSITTELARQANHVKQVVIDKDESSDLLLPADLTFAPV